MAHKVISPWFYLAIFTALLVLTGVTVWVNDLNLGPLHAYVALAIAAAKAALVVLFFMHVLYSSRLTWVVIFSAVFMFLLLWGVTLLDYVTRYWLKFY
jgi:cytochrome c oxidase subunit 4